MTYTSELVLRLWFEKRSLSQRSTSFCITSATYDGRVDVSSNADSVRDLPAIRHGDVEDTANSADDVRHLHIPIDGLLNRVDLDGGDAAPGPLFQVTLMRLSGRGKVEEVIVDLRRLQSDALSLNMGVQLDLGEDMDWSERRMWSAL
jgi:hypothetical protein